MKRVVRSNVFETASSSVHTFVVPKECDFKTPKKKTLTANVDSYGWDFGVLTTAQEKLDYFITALFGLFINGGNKYADKDDYYNDHEFVYFLKKYYNYDNINNNPNELDWFDWDVKYDHGYITLNKILDTITTALNEDFSITFNISWKDLASHWEFVDHCYECVYFIAFLLGDKRRLYSYLFNNESKVYLGNDNCVYYHGAECPSDFAKSINNEVYYVFTKNC